MAKLYCILARAAHSAVIFRRGPSTQVRLIRWDLREHTFQPGQWLKGRIYERKSDLSPNGERLVYFAAKFRGDSSTWTAVSKPPRLTALVLWRGHGTWNDISLFESDDRLSLATYRADSPLTPEEGFIVPRGLGVTAKPWPGFFYRLPDHPRLIREGWTVHAGDPVYGRQTASRADPVVYRKPIPVGGHTASLEMSVWDSHKISHVLCDGLDQRVDLGADWSDVRKNEVFYSRGGKLMRRRVARTGKKVEFKPADELADFTGMKFESQP